ncbi:uncharacterized protein RCH25_000008 isoform 2-T2 [Pelodytes ibericus]
MWKWYAADGTPPAGRAPDSEERAGTMSVADLTEQLAQTEQLVVQLKELIREKDNELRLRDQQLKEEKESSESKVSKAKLQNKAKIASLTSQLEDLKKQGASPKKQEKKSENRKASGDGDQESASASRGKILVLKRRVEELESQLSLKNDDLKQKDSLLEAQRLRGSEMDAMLAEKEKKLAEKEAYIIDLQMAAGKTNPKEAAGPEDSAKNRKDSENQDLQALIHNLTRKVGESDERCSLLQEQTDSLKSLLNKEKNGFQEKEAMYTENIRVYQNIILEKEKEMKDLSQKHEQDLFKLAAKSDASADLHQLLKALKQKLHEEEEVLLGKNQVIDVLQKELDSKDQQITEINEKCKRLQSEKENLQSKLEAEKHVMRAQLRDMMDKHGTELRQLSDKHRAEIQGMREKHEMEMQEKSQASLQKRLEDPTGENQAPTMDVTSPAVTKLQDEVKLKTEEASKSDAKFLKMKAWSKSKIRQLEEELKITDTKTRDLSNRISELEQEKREMETKLESLTDVQSLNEQLLAKLVIYEEQQRKLQADLEQVTKRADSQTSESGSVDELQHQLLEWNEMSIETEQTPDPRPEEKSVLAMRMAEIEEEREAMDSGQQGMEEEEELSTARGMGKLRNTRRKGSKGPTRLQDEYNRTFEDGNLTLESIESVEGENMGGLRTVVEELELERNQLQEQIMSLEERCHELEDRLQLQVRLESLQAENERLQTQIAQFRHQHSRESEKHHDLFSTLNEQLKGLTDRNLFLENSTLEKEQALQESAAKLEQLAAIKKTLLEKELFNKELCEKLDYNEQQLDDATKKRIASERENSALKMSNSELAEKVSALKERVSKQDSSLQKIQLDLDQTNEELDRLNTSHLEERSQLIYDLQRCEREMDTLKEALQEKEKEMLSLSASLTEYAEQVAILKEQMHFKEEQMREMADALMKAERENHVLRDAQSLDMQETSSKIASLSEQMSEMDVELNKEKCLNETRSKEAEELIRQINENGITIKNLRSEIQAQSVTHSNHVIECSSQITSLKEQLNLSVVKLDETETKSRKEIESLKSQLEKDVSEREKIAGLLEEKSNKETSFENELKLAKEQHNQLVSGMAKKDDEMEQLAKELTEQKARNDKLNKELKTREEHWSSLQQHSESILQQRTEELGTLAKTTQELQKQLGEKTEAINDLETGKNHLHLQNQLLEKILAERDQSLTDQSSLAEELTRKMQDLQEKNQHLVTERDHLVEAMGQKVSEISSLNQALLDIECKITSTENLLTEERTTVSQLLKDKEGLLAKMESISAQYVQKDSVVAAQFEEKLKECLSLKEQLTKGQEASENMQTQMCSLEYQLQEAHRSMQEKDDALQTKMAEFDVLCGDLAQNQERNTQLLKQVEELAEDIEYRKQALQEKDALIKEKHVEAEEVRTSFDKLKDEEHQLREEHLKVIKQIDELNATLQRLQQELVQKMEENGNLSKTLENGIKETENLRQEKEEALSSSSSLKSHCDSLQNQVVQSQSESESLKQQLSSLRLETENLSSDVELANMALAKKAEEINLLSSHLSQQGHTILSLNDQIDMMCTEKKTLLQSVEEKEALLFQKEELIKQTEIQLAGEGHYLQQISALQNELQSSVSERTLQQRKLEDQDLELRKLVQEVQLYRNKSEEAELLRTQLSEHVEVISDLHGQLQSLRQRVEELNVSLTKKDDSLKEKVDSYVTLKAQFSEVQESLEIQKNQTGNLILESEQYKADLLDKGSKLENLMPQYEDLKLKLHSKEEQCRTLMQQMACIEEINRSQTSKINELNVLLKGNATSLLQKEDLLHSKLEEKATEVSDLQGRVQELGDKIKALEQSTTDKENTMQNLQDKYASLYEQKRALEQLLITKEEDLSQLQKTLEEKYIGCQAAEHKVQVLTKETELLRAELDKSVTDFKNALNTLKEKEESLSHSQHSIQFLQQELDALNPQYQKSISQLHELTQVQEQKELFILQLQETCSSQSQQIGNLKTEVVDLNSKLLQVQHDMALQKEEFRSRLESSKMSFEQELHSVREEKSLSLANLEKHLMEKSELVKALEEQFACHAQESEEQIRSETCRLENENADLRKQVSGHAEEVCALKGSLENLEHNRAELLQQSEHVYDQIINLENNLQAKENAIQILLKDLRFVEEQLSVLCDDHFSEYSSFAYTSDCKSNLEKLSSMFYVASNYKSDVAQLKEKLDAKESEIDQKSQELTSVEKERGLLEAKLQKLKGEMSERESVIEEFAAVQGVCNQQEHALQEKEERLQELSIHLGELQKEVEASRKELEKSHLVLDEESHKVLELIDDAKKKDFLVHNLNIQLNQQKDLIIALSDQIKEKDFSLTQVMESMSNQMVRFSEEKNSLSLQLQNLEMSKNSCLLETRELSEKLEACKVELEKTQKTLADKEGQLSSLASEKDLQVEKFNKEKENLRRKLQAALVIRKDLMQKIEKLEKSKQDEIGSEKLKTAELEDTVKELNQKLEGTQSQNVELQSQMQQIKQELLEKEARASELEHVLGEKEGQHGELRKVIVALQHTIAQKEGMCEEYSATIHEKDLRISEIQVSLSEKVKRLEEENVHLLENLKSNLQRTQYNIEGSPERPAIFTSSGYGNLENGYAQQGLTIFSSDTANAGNNVHGLDSCNNENLEGTTKGKWPTDPELLNSIIQEFERLKTEHGALLNSYDARCKEDEQNREQIVSLEFQTKALEEQISKNRMQLKDGEHKVEELRQEIEVVSQVLDKVEQYENKVFEFKANVHVKDEKLVTLNSKIMHLVRKSQILEGEKQEEISGMKHLLNQQDQDEIVKETMVDEITLLRKQVETSRMEAEGLKHAMQKVNIEKEDYLKTYRVHQSEVEKITSDLELACLALLEKDKELATLKGAIQKHTETSQEEIKLLHMKLKESLEEASRLQISINQVKEELKENIQKLDKANGEISQLQMKAMNSRMEVETPAQSGSSKGLHQNGDFSPGLPEIKPQAGEILEEGSYVGTVCVDCSRNQILVEKLESQVLQLTQEQKVLLAKQEQRISEECSAKEHTQRKLQAALISRKDLLKENKALKERLDHLNLETLELKRSVVDIDESKSSELSSFAQKYQELVCENERLLLDNENLSAACESLKSTMETIVQEKEAFSFQLNSLKDSQTVELSGWKAKHGELNKEYESLLQAYENISDEIDKMRQVIEITKKEKLELLHRFHTIRAENQELEKQIQETNEGIDRLKAQLDSKEQDLQRLLTEVDGQVGLLKSGTEKQQKIDELSLQNCRLMEENQDLQENCESLKLSLENKEKENHSLLDHKTDLDNLQLVLDTCKAEMEDKISEMTTNKEVMATRVTELSRELSEREQSLAKAQRETSELLEKLSNTELSLEAEKSSFLKLESDISSLSVENTNLNEKVKILEDDKALLLKEIENVQEQFYKVKNERENLETELLNAGSNNSHLSDKFKSLQEQTNVLSRQVECLRTEKNNIMRAKEEHQLQVLRELEERVKCAQNDNRGTKSRSKELQELLKEKQQEINQLQRDSIRFQELILDLELSAKESKGQLEVLKKELGSTTTKLANASQALSSLNDELSVKNSVLQSAVDQIAYLTTQLSHFRPEIGVKESERIKDSRASGTRREEVVLTEANSDGMALLDIVEGSKVNRESVEQDLLLKNKYSNEDNISESNGVVTGRLKEKGEEVQSTSLLSRNTKDVDNQLKAVQAKLIKRDKDLQHVRLEQQKLRADLEKQLTISKHMKQIIDNKDAEISVLLSSKDGEISNYLSHVQSQYRKQAEDYERQLSSFQVDKEKSDKECQRVEAELKSLRAKYDKAINEKSLISSEIEAFRKSMSSLQTDRDLLCSELKDIHHLHQTLLNQKDGIIISSASENNSLKQELRAALNQIDDLNAESAMLGAQLVRYREDLNQVLSLKEHQLKELLGQKLEHIKNLEREKCDLQKQNREIQSAHLLLKQASDALELENQKIKSKARDQETLIAAINKDQIFFESRKKNNLGLEMLEQVLEPGNRSDNRAREAENLYDKGAKPVDETEEKSDKTYWEIYKENKELRSQNESFGKAMAALQEDRDSLIEDFKVLQWRYAGELKAEKIHGEDLEKRLYDFKSHLYSILKKNSLLDETLLATESAITFDQLTGQIEAACSRLTSQDIEVSRLSSECACCAQQIDAFSKAMASLQHDRERLIHQLRVGTLVREAKQGLASGQAPLNIQETEYFTMDLAQPIFDNATQVTDSILNATPEFSKSRPKAEELESLLQQAKALQEKADREITAYQYELAELRSEKSILSKDAQSFRHQFNTSLADKDRQIAELNQSLQEQSALGSTVYRTKNVERITLLGSPGALEKEKPLSDAPRQAENHSQIHLQEIQKDLQIQQMNTKAMEAVKMNEALSSQLKAVSQSLKDTQMRYSELQSHYYKLQRDSQAKEVTSRSDLRVDVPLSGPQETPHVLVEIENPELFDLRRRLAETEVYYDTTRREMSFLSEKLAEEKARREAAEEALNLAERQNDRLETKSSRDYEFSLQMDSDDEREALIIDPSQNVVVRKMKGGALSFRRWLRGRSLYCSKLLTSRSKSRYLFLTYLLMLHVTVLMCLTGVL